MVWNSSLDKAVGEPGFGLLSTVSSGKPMWSNLYPAIAPEVVWVTRECWT